MNKYKIFSGRIHTDIFNSSPGEINGEFLNSNYEHFNISKNCGFLMIFLTLLKIFGWNACDLFIGQISKAILSISILNLVKDVSGR